MGSDWIDAIDAKVKGSRWVKFISMRVGFEERDVFLEREFGAERSSKNAESVGSPCTSISKETL